MKKNNLIRTIKTDDCRIACRSHGLTGAPLGNMTAQGGDGVAAEYCVESPQVQIAL